MCFNASFIVINKCTKYDDVFLWLLVGCDDDVMMVMVLRSCKISYLTLQTLEKIYLNYKWNIIFIYMLLFSLGIICPWCLLYGLNTQKSDPNCQKNLDCNTGNCVYILFKAHCSLCIQNWYLARVFLWLPIYWTNDFSKKVNSLDQQEIWSFGEGVANDYRF